MSRENIATVVKILEYLSDAQQERIIEHLREYVGLSDADNAVINAPRALLIHPLLSHQTQFVKDRG